MRPAPRRLVPVAAAVLGALLLTGCSAAGARLQVPWLGLSVRLPGATPSPSPQALATPEATALPTPAISITAQQFVPIAEAFVERRRGLRFKAPVQVTLLDDAAFRERLLGKQNSGSGDAALSTTSKDLVALHLLDRSVDLGTAARDLLGAGVSGFYDPRSKSLVVRGVAATPYVRQVIVHELTHALQDQWFGIDRPDLDKADDERAIAFQTVVEGDAVRIENEYHNAMTPQEQAQADAEEQGQGGGPPGNIPPALVQLVAFPYIAGPRFIDALDQAGGQQLVDQAFVHPPVDTAQILDTDRYLQHVAPRPVALPRADSTVYDHGATGELGLLMLFEDVLSMTPPQAVQDATLWGGDEYVAWQKGSTDCVRMAVLARSAADQAGLDDPLRRFAAAVGGTFSDSGGKGPAIVTSCG